MGCFLTLALALGVLADDPWCVLYDAGFQVDNVAAWTSPLTSSEKTPEGLRIGDPSTDGGSGRFYRADWQVDPQAGATVETCLKVVSCSGPWGVVLLVSDGVHEEGVTFFPEQVTLAWAGTSVPFVSPSGTPPRHLPTGFLPSLGLVGPFSR